MKTMTLSMGCIFAFAAALVLSSCDCIQRDVAVTVESSGQPTLEYPMEVFEQRTIPPWNPGEALPLEVNQALAIADTWIKKNHPDLASRPRMAQNVSLKHLTDSRWYYEYSAWLTPTGGPPSTPVSVAILLDGSIWEPKAK